jgi:hypothetical protein
MSLPNPFYKCLEEKLKQLPFVKTSAQAKKALNFIRLECEEKNKEYLAKQPLDQLSTPCMVCGSNGCEGLC